MPDWPPTYTIRRHPRAKYARLRIDPRRGLEVVLPKGIPDFFADDLIHQRRAWVERHLSSIEVPIEDSRPDRLYLAYQEQELSIVYMPDAKRSLEDRLSLHVPEKRWKAALQTWLKSSAKRHLSDELSALAHEHGFHFDRLRIGLQKSRWGSCSSRGTIALNAALLLLEKPLARHVMLHELCHTEHMHHGPAFYSRLRGLDPDTSSHHHSLREAWRKLPAWLFEREKTT